MLSCIETLGRVGRSSLMKRMGAFFALAVGALMLGCGGGGTIFTQVSGVVTDLNGEVVRGAKVWCNDRETLSNSGGVYVLTGIGSGNRQINAEITRQNITYTGHNVVRIFPDERSKNVNIAVYPSTQQAAIHGVVRDRDGFRVAGARVFANGGTLSSLIAISDENGDYQMEGMASGLNYSVTASGRTWDSDTISLLLAAQEDRNVDFILDDPADPLLPPPQNLSAVAWTTPFEESRSPANHVAYDAIKRMVDERYNHSHPRTRVSTLGNHVEVDLYWDALPSQYFDSLLGFGIYRATSPGGPWTPSDFLRDPYALFYSDVDDNLNANDVYYYEITALNTLYPDTQNSESNPSNVYGVETLDDMRLLPVTQSPLTFHWQAVAGADNYMVFLFGEFPGIGVTAFWDNSGSPTVGTSLVYSGPALQQGKRYYYVVLGTANSLDSRTLSIIDSFVAN